MYAFTRLLVFLWKEDLIIPNKECKGYSLGDQVYNFPQHPYPYPLQGVMIKPTPGLIASDFSYKGIEIIDRVHVHYTSLPFVLTPLFFQRGYHSTLNAPSA